MVHIDIMFQGLLEENDENVNFSSVRQANPDSGIKIPLDYKNIKQEIGTELRNIKAAKIVLPSKWLLYAFHKARIGSKKFFKK